MISHLITSVGKIQLDNPVMISSGVCGFAEENRNVLNLCGAVVFKTVTLQPKEGNPPPRVVDFPYGMLNSIGLENPGVDNLTDKIKYIKKLRCKKVASFFAEKEEDFVIILKKLESYKIFDAYEINLSCPNVDRGGWFSDKKLLKKLLISLRDITDKTLIAKLSPEMDVFAVVKLVIDTGIDAVTLFNTYKAVAVDYENMRFKLSNIYGGYSGPAVKPLVQRWVYDVYKTFKIDIIASGGVTTGSDVVEYILLGAKAVQIGSGYFRNPKLPVECIKFVKDYLKNKKLSLPEIRGFLVK